MGHSSVFALGAAYVVGALAGYGAATVAESLGMGDNEKYAIRSVVAGFAGLATTYAINAIMVDPVGASVTTAAVSGSIAANSAKIA